MKGYVDLHKIQEDDRIKIIGDYCLEHPNEKVAVPTDDEPGKPERYKEKIESRYPQLKVEIKGPLTPGTILLTVQKVK